MLTRDQPTRRRRALPAEWLSEATMGIRGRLTHEPISEAAMRTRGRRAD
ncbi:hypothetical protein [Actinokineospora alba]|nr:hypothetical protein [Actinokineospora alba]